MGEERRGAASLPPTPHGAGDMFIPLGASQRTPRYDFSGFGEEMEKGKDYVLRRRLTDLEREMRERTVKGRQVMGALERVMKGRNVRVSMVVKKGIRNSVILLKLSYASETWT